LLNACIIILLHTEVTMLKVAGDAVVSTLWRFKCSWHNYSEIVV